MMLEPLVLLVLRIDLVGVGTSSGTRPLIAPAPAVYCKERQWYSRLHGRVWDRRHRGILPLLSWASDIWLPTLPVPRRVGSVLLADLHHTVVHNMPVADRPLNSHLLQGSMPDRRIARVSLATIAPR